MEDASDLLLPEGTLAPDFTVQDREGKPIRLSDFQGRVVLLDFWATWCGPCKQAMPHTAEIARKYQDQGVVVFAVNVWDRPEAMEAWLQQHPEYEAVIFAIDTAEKGKDVARTLYQVPGIPTQYVIDRQGTIVRGFLGWDESNPEIEAAIRAGGGF